MIRKLVWIICAAVLMLGVTAVVPNAKAMGLDDSQSIVKFNQPIEVPGHVILPAGTYWFVAKTDFGSSPDEVLIYNSNRTRLEARVQTIPTTRMALTGRNRFTFAEQPNGRPVALLSWFGAGRMTGHQFVYSSRKEANLQNDYHVSVAPRPGQTVTVG